jgi:valyl-tRNA synthetase
MIAMNIYKPTFTQKEYEEWKKQQDENADRLQDLIDEMRAESEGMISKSDQDVETVKPSEEKVKETMDKVIEKNKELLDNLAEYDHTKDNNNPMIKEKKTESIMDITRRFF